MVIPEHRSNSGRCQARTVKIDTTPKGKTTTGNSVDDHKNKDNPKNKDYLKNKGGLKMKTTIEIRWLKKPFCCIFDVFNPMRWFRWLNSTDNIFWSNEIIPKPNKPLFTIWGAKKWSCPFLYPIQNVSSFPIWKVHSKSHHVYAQRCETNQYSGRRNR